MSLKEEIIWFEKYRPQTIDEVILPEDLKTTFKQFVKSRKVPNLLLSGGPGVGKTTVAMAMLKELKSDYIVINGSLEGRQIDTLRNDIANYATSMSIRRGGRKYVILDEADYLNPQSVQPALRNFMESYSKNCGFILTCNYKNKIIEPLHSRCSLIEFKIPKDVKAKLQTQFFKRIIEILKAENVKYDTKVIAQIINKYFPDYRKVLSQLQSYAETGRIDSGILANFQEESFHDLIRFMREKDFSNLIKWVNDSNMDSADVYKAFYDHCSSHFMKQALPVVIMVIAKYQYQDSFALDKTINLAACLLEIMSECPFQESSKK